ncbi:hypothetical protein TRFO_16455 [Tritrichomonas foetus]|uniref:Uncharacterized protein n=1 Tax=Tritrichomonas foetus TaxID=1144522 RepID=A0A1J4KR14_9EUKA|nr:hypothetical protein TRFO_16455 [Tritrichomonas foetus]|eukprot:OHT13368.1 hypothetical protein TRFO_16455 [Tritrichomonas foetus]
MVRIKENSNTSKKVLLPNSLPTLKKNIRVLFKLNNPIQALYTEDGHLIQFLHEIVPGEIIYASTLDPGFQSVSQIPKPQSPMIFKSPSQQGPSGEKRSRSPGQKARDAEPKYETFGLSPNIVSIGNLSPLLVDQSKLHYTLRDTKNMKRANEPEKETEEESTKKKRTRELEKYAEQLPDSLKRLFNVLDDEESWVNDIMPLITSLPLNERVLLVDSERITKEQNEFWLENIRHLFDELFEIKTPEKYVGADDIRQFSSQIIENHRFVTHSELSYSMRCVIVGPRNSGKSVFLKYLSTKIANEFVRTGTNAHKFFVAFDMKRLSISLTDYAQFYTDMVDIVCNCLAIQKPLWKKLIKTDVKPFLLSVMNSDPPNFKKTLLVQHEFKEFFNNVQAIGELLNLFWNDSQCLTQWYTNVSFLPVLIGAAAGFDETFFVIDHLDYCDQNFMPSGRFESAGESVFVSEYFKFTLSNSSYIAACEDSTKLYTLLVDVDDTFNYAPFELISMDEIQSDAARNETLIVEIDGVPKPLKIGPEICGGIPAYIALWNQVVEVVSAASKQRGNEDEKEDAKLVAVAQVQTLLELCFVIDDDDENPLTRIIPTDVRLQGKEAKEGKEKRK